MKKNKLIIFIFLIASLILTSCTSIKKGLTGQNKKNGTDEILVKKKLPLVLPPNFKTLPTPTMDIKVSKKEEKNSDILKNIIGINTATKKLEPNEEESILKKIIKDNVN